VIHRVLLGEVIDVASGQVDPREQPYCDLPHVGGDNIESGGGRLSDLRTARELNLISGKYEFGPNDVLYSKIRPALNKVALPEFVGICSADIYPLRPHTEHLERRYLAYLLRQDDFLAYAESHSSRTNIPKINRDALLAYEVQLPSLAEQRRIADVLDKADAIRRKRREATALTEELLRSAFLEVFGDPMINPKGWAIKPLTDLCESKQYGTAEKANSERLGIPVIRMNNLTYSGEIDLTNLKWVPLSKSEVSKLDLRDGDVVFNRVNSHELVGKTATWHHGEGYTFAGYLIRLRILAHAATGDYISAAMNMPSTKRTLMSMAKPSINMANISGSDLARVLLPVPPLPLQRRYVALKQRVDSLRKRYRDAERDAHVLFASLVQRMFRDDPAGMNGAHQSQLELFDAGER
jgi:type I restriction enzyme S subunit